MAEIKIREGEHIDKALRRFKKKIDRENVIREVKARKQYEKPSSARSKFERQNKKRIARENRIARNN